MNVYFYDRLLERKVRRRGTPDHVAVVTSGSDLLDGGFETVSDLLCWFSELEVERVSLYVSLADSDDPAEIYDGISRLDIPGVGVDAVGDSHGHGDGTSTHRPIDIEEAGGSEDETRVKVSVGLGGRNEFVGALRQMAREVEDDELDPDDVDEETIERHLVFKGEPDMMITGNDRLSDFMIWQSVYTELYFADFSWDSLRKRDLLRAFREFQDRERRFGK
ncbi:undecaprenyl diphosphate synthase family protein [Halorutilales archaeon Cl-col2-1]